MKKMFERGKIYGDVKAWKEKQTAGQRPWTGGKASRAISGLGLALAFLFWVGQGFAEEWRGVCAAMSVALAKVEAGKRHGMAALRLPLKEGREATVEELRLVTPTPHELRGAEVACVEAPLQHGVVVLVGATPAGGRRTGKQLTVPATPWAG